jgi:type IV secretory pathway VirB10-like protein
MSGPNPPGPESEELEPGVESSQGDDGFDGGDGDFGAGAGESDAEHQTGQTDVYSQAYSAPESEHISSGPYVPANLDLYDYDNYDDAAPRDQEEKTARWPWIVGVAAIVAAIALVVSVSLLFARTDTNKLATPDTAPPTPSSPPMQDEIIVTTTTHVPPPTSASEASPPPPPPNEAPPAPAPEPAPAPAPAPAPPAPAPAPAPAGPKQYTYSVTGTKAPFDQITITYTDASGMRRTLSNVYIPWTITLTPISASDVGSIEASSLLRLSKLNCKVTASDGTVLSANENNQPQVNC